MSERAPDEHAGWTVLSESKLAAALTDMTVEQWLRLLNSKVFFWLQRERVNRLLGARAYRDSSHLVITFDTQFAARPRR